MPPSESTHFAKERLPCAGFPDPAAHGSEDERSTPACQVVKYRLKAYMNMREKPSLSAAILGTKSDGEIVDVAALENDWLFLADGSCILYNNAAFRERTPRLTAAGSFPYTYSAL